jgi:4-hydroxy-tetrahydrodipicolinate synthase
VIPLGNPLLIGSYPPLVTPFREGAVDLGTYARLVDFHARSGSRGVVVCGTSGEPSLLTVAERQELAEVAVDTAAGRIPVVVATGSQSHAETAALTDHAAAAGAAALLIVTPYYVRPPERGLVEYFAELGNRTQIPWALYHIPGRAAVGVTLDVLDRIASRSDTFAGIKHASADLGLVTEALAHFGTEFRVLVGLEELSFPMLALGASGVVNAVGNLAPAEVQELCAAVADGDLGRARTLHFDLFELNRAVFWDTNPIPVKYLMKRIGLLPDNEHRLPMAPATPELAARLDALADARGLVAAGEHEIRPTSTTGRHGAGREAGEHGTR